MGPQLGPTHLLDMVVTPEQLEERNKQSGRKTDPKKIEAMSAALAGGLLVSLTLMGSSRKIFGPEVVQQYLVPHRVDIGVATFFSIGIAVSVQLGLLSTSWGVGGASHIVVAALAQLGYLMSLIGRGDLLSSRLFLLILTWVGIVLGTVTVQVVMEVELFFWFM